MPARAASPVPLSPLAVRGRQVFEHYSCQTCHGAGGLHGTAAAPGLAGTASILSAATLENLLRQLPQRRPPADRHRQRKLMINHIGILVHAVSSRLAPRRTQDSWIADAHPLFRQYRAVAVLCVCVHSSSFVLADFVLLFSK